MITREEALQTIHDCRITSIGELSHGYVVYQTTANTLINQLFDQFESQLSINPLQLTCDGCVMQNDFFKGGCATHAMCIRKSTDNYQPKDTK